jgi:hypothetical protein
MIGVRVRIVPRIAGIDIASSIPLIVYRHHSA